MEVKTYKEYTTGTGPEISGTHIVERSGGNWVGRISKSPRYVTVITGPDPLSF